MEVLNLIGSICSILALIISIIVLTQINSIKNTVTASGSNSKAAGGNITETGK